MTLEAVTRYCD